MQATYFPLFLKLSFFLCFLGVGGWGGGAGGGGGGAGSAPANDLYNPLFFLIKVINPISHQSVHQTCIYISLSCKLAVY